jgi:hypothetical protein
MATRPVEDFVKDLFQSEEYRTALKQRVLDGTAKKHEIELAQSLGLAISEEDQARENVRAMDRPTMRLLMDLIVVSESKASTTLRRVEAPGFIGVVMPTSLDMGRLRSNIRDWSPAGPNTTEPSTTEDPGDLMPAKPRPVT